MEKDYFWYLGEIAAKLSASGSALNYAVSILKLAKEKLVTSGRNPRVLAAAALYLAQFSRLGPLSERWTQKQVALAAGVGEPAVRNTYHLLIKKLALPLPGEVSF